MSKDPDDFDLDLSPRAWQSGNPDNRGGGSPRGLPVADSDELKRILALPRRPPVTEGSPTAEALIQLAMQKYGRRRDPAQDAAAMAAHDAKDYVRAREIWGCKCAEIDPFRYAPSDERPPAPCLAKLLWAQAWALYEMEICGGLLALISVGYGKTFLDILGGLALRNAPISLLLIPPSLVDQIMVDYELVSQHFQVPGFVVHVGARESRKWLPEKDALGRPLPTTHVLPYSRLSDVNSSAWIDNLAPSAIIADECFSGDTRVLTDEGWLPIADVVDRQRGTFAYAVDLETEHRSWKRITHRMRKQTTKRLVKVTHEHGSVTCTEDHKIWTQEQGYVKAWQLNSSHTLVHAVLSDVPDKALGKPILLQRVSRDLTTAQHTTEDLSALHARVQIERSKTEVLQHPLQEPRKSSQGASVPTLRNNLHTQGQESEVLQCKMWQGGEWCTCSRELVQEARWSTSNRDPSLPTVQPRVSDCSVYERSLLQSEVCRTVSPSGNYNVSHMSPNVQTVKDWRQTLLSQVCREELTCQEETTEERHAHHEELHRVWQGVQDQETRQGYDKVLHPKLRNQSRVTWQTSPRLRSASENESVRVQQECRNDGGSTCEVEGPHVSVTGRKRPAHQATTTPAVGVGTRRRLDGARDRDIESSQNAFRESAGDGRGTQELHEVVAGQLQGRHWLSRDQAGDRDRREFTSHEEVEVHRPTQDGRPGTSRVVRVEVLEQGGPGGDRTSGLGDPVYDLTVEDTHNYFAEGVLVSNCDALKDLSSARSLRVARRLASSWRTTRFVGLTGSGLDKGVSELSHLAAWALRGNSPMPLDRQAVDEWGRSLDAVPNPAPPGALTKFLAADESATLLSVRRAYGRRLRETQGVIVIGGRQAIITASGEEVELDIREKQAPIIPPVIHEALRLVRMGRRPDTLVGGERDDIFEDPMRQAVCARAIASGVLQRWIFPRREPHELIAEWYEARKLWFSELRATVLGGEVYLDSPKNCENAARRYHGDLPPDSTRPSWAAQNWPRWRDIMDKVEPQPETRWLSTYLAEDAAQWATENKGIVWYAIREFGAKVGELAGIPVYGEGTGSDIVRLERGHRSIVASIEAHGRGRDRLQFMFNKQLLAQMPSSDRRATQLLGRLHRRGQQSEEVETLVYQHTPEVQASLQQVLRRGEFVEAITGESRKFREGWRG